MDKYLGVRLDNRYEIREVIGVGGMAIVYKAYDRFAERNVAVKILKDEFAEDEEFRRRFKNESRAIAMFSHPNIVSIYDVGSGDGPQYIVMEYINGITLQQYIDVKKVLPLHDAIAIMEQTLKGIQHALNGIHLANAAVNQNQIRQRKAIVHKAAVAPRAGFPHRSKVVDYSIRCF